MSDREVERKQRHEARRQEELRQKELAQQREERAEKAEIAFLMEQQRQEAIKQQALESAKQSALEKARKKLLETEKRQKAREEQLLWEQQERASRGEAEAAREELKRAQRQEKEQQKLNKILEEKSLREREAQEANMRHLLAASQAAANKSISAQRKSAEIKKKTSEAAERRRQELEQQQQEEMARIQAEARKEELKSLKRRASAEKQAREHARAQAEQEKRLSEIVNSAKDAQSTFESDRYHSRKTSVDSDCESDDKDVALELSRAAARKRIQELEDQSENPRIVLREDDIDACSVIDEENDNANVVSTLETLRAKIEEDASRARAEAQTKKFDFDDNDDSHDADEISRAIARAAVLKRVTLEGTANPIESMEKGEASTLDDLQLADTGGLDSDDRDLDLDIASPAQSEMFDPEIRRLQIQEAAALAREGINKKTYKFADDETGDTDEVARSLARAAVLCRIELEGSANAITSKTDINKPTKSTKGEGSTAIKKSKSKGKTHAKPNKDVGSTVAKKKSGVKAGKVAKKLDDKTKSAVTKDQKDKKKTKDVRCKNDDIGNSSTGGSNLKKEKSSRLGGTSTDSAKEKKKARSKPKKSASKVAKEDETKTT